MLCREQKQNNESFPMKRTSFNPQETLKKSVTDRNCGKGQDEERLTRLRLSTLGGNVHHKSDISQTPRDCTSGQSWG